MDEEKAFLNDHERGKDTFQDEEVKDRDPVSAFLQKTADRLFWCAWQLFKIALIASSIDLVSFFFFNGRLSMFFDHGKSFLPACPHAEAAQRFVQGYLHNAGIASEHTTVSAGVSWDPSVIEKHFEREFLQIPSAESAKDALQNLTAITHIAGSKQDYNTAISVMEEWGRLLGAKVPDNSSDSVFDAGSSESVRHMTGTRRDWQHQSTHPLGSPRVWVDTYSVWLNYAVSSSLTLSKSDDSQRPYFTASLREDVVQQDPTSVDGSPTFHGYSKSGKASGPIVYAGSCSYEDFQQLESKNVSVKGAVTLCRYGGAFRGLKVRMSAQHGAVGTLIYSDPKEDGEITEKNGYKHYPDGPARQPSAVQRGSVQAISIYPGDASTPNKPSYRNASRIDAETADALPKIPSLPVSYLEAKPFLEAVSGKGINTADLGEHWQGAVPGVSEYWTGPSNDIVDLDNQMTDITKPQDIWNTYALIPGVLEDEVVIVSNHRDAWTFGAADPNSGTATVHEVVAGLGSLVKKGWRPLRTILIASWDAEEYGLIGSTEAAEDYAEFFKEKAVIFLNTDVAVSGSIANARSSPSLADLLLQTASEIKDPSGNGTTIQLAAPGALGSGSDYTAYLQNLGIASLDVGFTQGPKDPIYHYHSNYDSFFWQSKFGDPGFSRHYAMAQFVGLLTLRSAQGVFLPLNVSNYALALSGYLDKVKNVAPKDLNLSVLEDTIRDVQRAAGSFEAERHHLEKQLRSRSRKVGAGDLRKLFARIRNWNHRAKHFETGFLSPDGHGLTSRSFYQHLGVAPGRYLGYGATTFPGLTESITLDKGEKTQYEIDRLITALKQVRRNISP